MGSWLGRVAFLIAGIILSAVPARAYMAARTFPPYTLTSANFAPSTTGEDVSEFDGDCTVNLIKSGGGTLAVNVEGKLRGGGFVAMGTALSGSSLSTVKGPVEFIRFNVTTCTGDCTTVAVLRCRAAP